MKNIVLAGLMAVLAAGPAMAAKGEGCLWADRIDGFRDATSTSIVLTVGGKAWKAETAGTCVGLNWANSVATVAKTSCLSEGDSIRFVDNGNFSRRCMISSIEKIEKTAEAE